MAFILNRFKQQRLMREQYFSTGRRGIALANLSILLVCSRITAFLLIVFVGITPYIINGWHITIHYTLFLVAMIVFVIIAQLLFAFKVENPVILNYVSILYLAALLGFLILIDVFPYPDLIAKFTPIFLAVFPVLFIFPPPLTIGSLIIAEILFVSLTMIYKPMEVYMNDIFLSLVGSFFGVGVSWIITELRVSDYTTKKNHLNLCRIDDLTGLLNKASFEESIRFYLRWKEQHEMCALLVVDIDNFKVINDQLGHQVGDIVLQEFGNRIHQIFRSSDYVGRFGGDEFVVLMKKVNDISIIQRKCDEVTSMIADINKDNMPFTISCSIGGVVLENGYADYFDLFRMADDALYEAKEFGKSRSVLYTYYHVALKKNQQVIIVTDEDTKIIVEKYYGSSYKVIKVDDGSSILSLVSQFSKRIELIICTDEFKTKDIVSYLKSRLSTTVIRIIYVGDVEDECYDFCIDAPLTTGKLHKLNKRLSI